MIRRALIIYCDNTPSDPLPGPVQDNANYRKFLTSYLGGEWHSSEIRSLQNPTKLQVEQARQNFMKGADYTFTIFTGHGCINQSDNNMQYAELSDGDISIRKLITDARRQAVIFDSCRGLERFESDEIIKSINEDIKMFSAGLSTRQAFDQAITAAEEGLTVLYSSSEDQSSEDSEDGALYLLSLLRVAEEWSNGTKQGVLDLKTAHENACEYIEDHFLTLQEPVMNTEKRKKYYPFAIKLSNQING